MRAHLGTNSTDAIQNAFWKQRVDTIKAQPRGVTSGGQKKPPEKPPR
jgi:hypothetical protein